MSTSTPILATKLYIPPPPSRAVMRPRLVERLNTGLARHCKLTLISAPAGSGKTTLVSEWLAAHPQPAAWLSLDEIDGELKRFLGYVIIALQKVSPDIGKGVLELLQSSQPPPAETLLTTLINEIAAIPANFLLVLDDYHVIDAKAVDEALAFLLEHLPPQMSLVITTREDPRLPLARMRVRGQLNELRAGDLRFTTAEAAHFLQEMGLNLSPDDVAALEDRTEGWIAGLQLAALSMQDRRDVSGFIRAFAGEHRYIVDYLTEEVLLRQPAPVRQFLLQTSILERLNGALCEAVTGQPDGKAILEVLERGNFFIVPLDDRREWYRYHHLFAEVLYAHLKAEQPDTIAGLHGRASDWYEQNGLRAAAIHHALAGGDFEKAAYLVELAVPEMRSSRQEVTLLGWLKALPVEILKSRPVLSIHYAGTLLLNGELAGVEALLQDVERWVDQTGQPGSLPARAVVVDQEEFSHLPGTIAIYRAGCALARGDIPGTINHARRALELLPENDNLGHGAAAGLLGLAYWSEGKLEIAEQSYNEGIARLQKAGHISDIMGLAIALASVRIARGRLSEAKRTYEQALQLAGQQGGNVLRGTADMYVGLGELALEFNDLGTAAQHLEQSQALGQFAGLAQNPYRWCVTMARLKQAQGDLGGALEMLDEAERVYVGDLFPYVRPIAALKARVWAVQGRFGEAFGWAKAQGLSADDDLNYLREYEHITLAGVLLAQARDEGGGAALEAAKGLLKRLLEAARAGGRTGSAIEILVLLGLASQIQGDTRGALAFIRQALALAEPEGYVRIFITEGAPAADLLKEAARQKIAPGYVRQLLAALGQPEAAPPAQHGLIEPLSDRELQVLRLLAGDLSGPEIARQLTVSLNTVNTHIKNIYAKLEVNNRRGAVRRAEELHLF